MELDPGLEALFNEISKQEEMIKENIISLKNDGI